MKFMYNSEFAYEIYETTDHENVYITLWHWDNEHNIWVETTFRTKLTTDYVEEFMLFLDEIIEKLIKEFKEND